ncbi:hypothetical protein [Trinickia mobilis]|uniref:hypothetical protein n=1 Tax=Trinickia mobilis TaxID=2816356 RepID=UPI001F5DBF50|nr:hypothetical protein [Trinickia mobilis]
MIEEVVLDEAELEDCHRTESDYIHASMDEADTSAHPGFPYEAMTRMMDEKLDSDPYPRKRLLRFDRVRADGEIVHPYAARRDERADGRSWIIQLYLPFTQEWTELRETEFLALPLSTRDAVRKHAERT